MPWTPLTVLERRLYNSYYTYLFKLPNTTFDQTTQFIESLTFHKIANTIEEMRRNPYIIQTTVLFNARWYRAIFLLQKNGQNNIGIWFKPTNYCKQDICQFHWLRPDWQGSKVLIDNDKWFWGALPSEFRTNNPKKEVVEDLLCRNCVERVNTTELSEQLIRCMSFRYSDYLQI